MVTQSSPSEVRPTKSNWPTTFTAFKLITSNKITALTNLHNERREEACNIAQLGAGDLKNESEEQNESAIQNLR